MSNEKTQTNLNLEPKTLHLKRVPWGPWAAILVAVVVYFAAQIMAAIVVSLYPRFMGWTGSQGVDWLNSSVFAQFFYVLVAEALTFGAIWWFIWRRKASLTSIGWRKFKAKDVVFALAGFGVYFLVYAILLSIVTGLVPSLNVNQPQDTGFQNAAGSLPLILTFVSLVILPPLVEETVFRGFLYSGLKNSFPVVWAAILTSLLFASAHLQFGNGKPLLWVAAIDTFTLSLVLCWLREKTGGLWAGITVHALKNGIAFVSLFLLHVH